MTFPIAVGTGPRHSSSRPFPQPSRGNGEGGGGGEGREDRVVMALGTNESETLTATVFISYHFISIHNATENDASSNNFDEEDNRTKDDCVGDDTANNDFSNHEDLREHGGIPPSHATTLQGSSGIQHNVVAELRVQITPSTSPFVSNIDAMSSRETKSRVPLGIMRKKRRGCTTATGGTTTTYAPNASVEFSSNDTHLACLIPLPISYEFASPSPSLSGGKSYAPTSTVVIFRIQAQKLSSPQRLAHKKHPNLPKLPEYIVEKSIIDGDANESSEHDNLQERSNSVGINETSQEESANLSSTPKPSRGRSVSYVAHKPKIVRVPHADDATKEALPNGRSFLRQLSGGGSGGGIAGPVQPPSLKHATCMCNAPASAPSSSVSSLLVGASDGSLLLVDFATAKVCSVALDPVGANRAVEKDKRKKCDNIDHRDFIGGHGWENGHGSRSGGSSHNPIVHLSQCAPSRWKPLDKYGEEQGSESKGRLALVLRDGSVDIYTTSFVIPSVLSSASNGGTDRNNGQRNRKKAVSENTGLEMRIEMLATHVSKPGPSLSCLRYVQSKWLNPLILVLLTRSPYLDQEFLFQESNAASSPPSEMVVAQVWTVAEVMHQNEKQSIDKVDRWESPPEVVANIALVSELKMPCGDSLDERVNDTFSLSQLNSVPADDEFNRISWAFQEFLRGMSIFYHRGTDCLAINSQAVTNGVDSLNVRPFCLVWDWKRNVPGFTLAGSKSFCLFAREDAGAAVHTATSVYSWFHLGEDDDYGLCAVHVYGQTVCRRRCRASKDVFSLSYLSPLNRFAVEGGLSVNEPSAVMLHRDSVTFPSLGRPSNMRDVSLLWRESRVPPAYVASNGRCRIAAVGQDHGRSIAVAASRGLCVLDLSQMPRLEPQHITNHQGSAPLSTPIQPRLPRWKQFSNINDEQCFRVVSMIWFERDNENTKGTKEGVPDDLLLAVVKYANNDALYLVCWSRKRLSFGENQLLKESYSRFTGEDDASGKGIALPNGFHVHSMSIIRDPADRLPSVRSTPSNQEIPNRALLLLSSLSCHEGDDSCVKFAVYQLQTFQSPNGKQLVLARNAACGRIPLQLGKSSDFSAIESVIGVFVAGGCFLYDLDTETVDDSALDDVIAVIGVITVFQGLIAVCVNETGPILYRPSLLKHSGEDCIGCRKSLIVSFWMSGSISSRFGCRVAWNIAENNGKVHCWSVPCRNSESSHWSSAEPNGEQCSLPGLERHAIIGDVCRLGSSSLWMNGATTSEREISIGPFCPLSFGCTLYAGQRSRKNSFLPDSVAMRSFHISNCTVAPPQFTPFLFISFLSLSSPSSDPDFEWQLVNRPGQETPKSDDIEICNGLERNLIKSTFDKLKNLGSSSSALRLLTLKVIDLLNSKVVGDVCLGNEYKGKLNNETISRLEKWNAGRAILSEIVCVAKEMYDWLGFATFWLSIGRQLEPHQFSLVFPLPLPPTVREENGRGGQERGMDKVETSQTKLCNSTDSSGNTMGVGMPYGMTPERLFSISCSSGSISTALSALPLFSCHEESQQSVTRLVYHCLIKIEENFHSCSSYTALTSGEDESFLHQLFWFGVKLEDAIEIEKSHEKQNELICTSDCNDYGHSVHSSESSASNDEALLDQATDDFISVSSSVESDHTDYSLETYSSEESNEVSFLSACRTPNQKQRAGGMKKVVKNESSLLEEDAIHEAASTFIFSGFDEVMTSMTSPPCAIPGSLKPVLGDDNPSDGGDTNAAASPLPELTPMTVAGAVSLFISHVIEFDGFSLTENTHGWKSVSAIAHLLQGDRETMAITTAGSANAQSIVSSIKVKDFLVGRHLPDEEDSFNTIASLLVHLTSDCCQQIHSQAFGTVFNLVLLLLLRYDSCHDVELCRATLIAVGIVSGHLSGRIAELLDLTETSCDVREIYSLYEEGIK